MGFVQIGTKVLVGGEIVAEADDQGIVTAMLCDLCNEMIPYDLVDGSRIINGSWQCAKCSAVN